jgi:PAS domain S-box-containing protein
MVPGYDIIEVIHEGLNTVVYLAQSELDRQPVILKVLCAEYPTLEQITRLKHEYKVTENLDLEGIIKFYRLETHQNGLVLVAEFGGISLKQFLSTFEECNLSTFLSIAVQLAKSLVSLHTHHIIHKDVKPANIIINPSTFEVKLTDFSIASRLNKETPQLSSPNQLEGTLAYMSPEQTGRMNRTLDYRSDFYSLGVTLYEILTLALPFQSNDPLEIVHCHIAKEPVAIQELNPLVPGVIAAIVTKLMAKNAEDRYQSAFGLLADLEYCLDQFKNTGQIPDFTLGRLDILSQLVIPQKLYGREKQVNSLYMAFERVNRGSSELILVSGYSGIGKSSVVNEVNKPITRQRGYFISGKFDQLKRNIPYISLIQAFSSLVEQLFSESFEQLEEWKRKILAAVGGNGQVIIDVIPEVELIIGKQLPVSQLGSTEAQNRFNRVFQDFIRVFTQKEHPLVIFLDDLQWADSATLKLMQLLIVDVESQYLLLIGAYRDNEVSPTHALIQTIEEIQRTGKVVNNILLEPLDLADVSLLVAETLNAAGSFEMHNLATLLWNKTGGNPFFLTQLLQALYQEKLLTFDFTLPNKGETKGGWVWNLSEIQAIGITDKSVVELVASRIEKLPSSTQEVLKLAGCIGDKFTLDVLSIVREESALVTANELYAALESGLILPLNETYKIPLVFDWEADNLPAKIFQVSYRFLHDRVQQAAYSLIPDSQKQATHLKIGQLLLKNTPKEKIELNIFDIVNQFNVGIERLLQENERQELAELNLIAGRKAKESAAYISALNYLQIGIDLLDVNAWHNHYDFTLDLHESFAETAYLIGSFELMQQCITTIFNNADSFLDKIKTYEVQIQANIAQNKLKEAVCTALEVLQQLEIKLPKNPHQIQILLGLAKTKLLLGRKIPQSLIHLPKMTNPHHLAAIKILSSAASAAYIALPDLMPLLVFERVNLSVKYGNTALSAFAYAWYGLILCGVVFDIKTGYQFGQLALELLEHFNAKNLRARTMFMTYGFVIHWCEHIEDTIQPLLTAYQSGLETGDVEYASWSAVVLCYNRYWMGQDLAEVEKIFSSFIKAIAPFNQNNASIYLRIFHQATLNLLGRSSDATILSGESYDIAESILAQEISSDRTGLFFSYVCQQQLHYLFGQYALSLEKGTAANSYVSGVVGLLPSVLFNFYDSLTKLAIYTNAVASKRKQILKQVAANQKKLKRWADSAPMNHQHKYDLVEAEKCRVLDKLVQAGNLYDRAIQGATENGYTQEVALFNELAAKFYLAQGRNKIAKVYFTDAYYSYIRWGAIAKVRHLEESYPELIIRSQIMPATDDITETLLENITRTQSTSINSEQLLDLATVMKATSAISEEIVLDNLLKKLLHIILENASAQKGCIILERNNQLFIEVADTSQTESTVVLESTPVETSQDVPVSLINYVAKTQKPQVFNNASQETIVKSDPYIREYQPKSVLCAPIFYQAKFRGIVYLENNLATGAFTRARLQLIQILTAQAAIAIENARLYSGEQAKSKQLAESLQQLAQKEEQYRGIFETAIDGLGICDIETGKFVAVNPANCQMYGFSALEWQNLQPQDFIHPDYLHLFVEFVQLIKAGKEFYGQAVVIRKDGTQFDVEVKASSYIYNGKLHALTITRDISKQQAALRDRQRAETALQQRSQDLFEALQKLQRTQGQLVQTEKISQLGQLVAGVAHEVNNPVSFISGNLSHTKQNVEDLINLLHLYQKYLPNPPIEITEEIENIDLEYLLEDLPKMISSMKLGTDRIRDIMQSLRNFSRADANEKKAVDIHQGLDTTLIVLSHRLKASPSRPAIQIVKEYGQIPAFECYSGQINQVFMNLLANAIDALEESNSGKTFAELQQNPNIIRIRTEIVNPTHELKICIADNGCGMPKEVRQNLFNAFFTTKSEGKGTGLGLSISHQIITEAHGGTLECFSNPGKGTEFVILMKEEGRRKKGRLMKEEGRRKKEEGRRKKEEG